MLGSIWVLLGFYLALRVLFGRSMLLLFGLYWGSIWVRVEFYVGCNWYSVCLLVVFLVLVSCVCYSGFISFLC